MMNKAAPSQTMTKLLTRSLKRAGYANVADFCARSGTRYSYEGLRKVFRGLRRGDPETLLDLSKLLSIPPEDTAKLLRAAGCEHVASLVLLTRNSKPSQRTKN